MRRILAVLCVSSAAARAATIAADSERGAALFDSLSCVQCHSVNGSGGTLGPDLGKLVDRNFTPATLAATMWNHAPTMWAAMRERNVRAGDLTEQDAADLLAFFCSARFFERPRRGARQSGFFLETLRRMPRSQRARHRQIREPALRPHSREIAGRARGVSPRWKNVEAHAVVVGSARAAPLADRRVPEIPALRRGSRGPVTMDCGGGLHSK